ncbi:MAG TPA: hypothetical protein VNI83_07860, partial [Vicinamibacterales bacterium]|nr:hypothetical protein [Vicinamibacterales bacterium]
MAAAPPLYRAQLERDACGLALLVDLDNRPSRELVDLALGALARLAHRGGGGDTSVPPDGAGILVRIPWSLLSPDLPRAPGECLAAGMLFFPRGAAPDLAPLVEAGLLAYGWEAIAWRPVPAVREVLHPRVAPSAPDIFQVFARPRAAAAPAGDAGVRERALYRARRLIEHRLAGASA